MKPFRFAVFESTMRNTVTDYILNYRSMPTHLNFFNFSQVSKEGK